MITTSFKILIAYIFQFFLLLLLIRETLKMYKNNLNYNVKKWNVKLIEDLIKKT